MIQTHMVMASKGECYKSLCGWPITNDQDKAQSVAKGGEREAVVRRRESRLLADFSLRTFSIFLF